MNGGLITDTVFFPPFFLSFFKGR